MNDYDPSVLVSQPEQEAVTETPETVETETVETEQETPADDSAPEAEQAPKPKKSAKDRIDEITWEKHEALRRAEAAEAERERLAAQLAQLSAYIPQPSDDVPPNPYDYEHGELDVNYIRDVTRYEIKLEQKAQDEQRAVQERHKTFSEKVSSFMAKSKEAFPDGPSNGLSVFLHASTPVTEEVAELVTASDVGPKLAEYLGENIAELHRINALPAHMKGFEIARIEARLSVPAETKPPPKPKAPTPPENLPRGTSGRFAVSPDTDDFSAFEKSYMRPKG